MAVMRFPAPHRSTVVGGTRRGGRVMRGAPKRPRSSVSSLIDKGPVGPLSGLSAEASLLIGIAPYLVTCCRCHAARRPCGIRAGCAIRGSLLVGRGGFVLLHEFGDPGLGAAWHVAEFADLLAVGVEDQDGGVALDAVGLGELAVLGLDRRVLRLGAR